jgi:AraC-like DNA-binding protein
LLRRLADILLIQAIRVHIASGNCGETGWLRALADKQVGAALESMHKSIGQHWTVAALAASAGMSRSAFALRFKELVGETPLEYLTRWRIYQAAMLLREGDKTLIDVAHSIGYDSDGAFNKAFKRIMGATPGDYRRHGGALPSLGCGGIT